MSNQFPITQTMQDNIMYLYINSKIISGVFEARADKNGNMPSEEDLRRRFWGAYNKLTEEVRNTREQRKADSLIADNQKLQERIKELEAQVNPDPSNVPF